MKAMITLTVAGGKRLIARAIVQMPEVRRAWEESRIVLKGGTTVSAVAEELVGVPMRISGRISPRGLRASREAGSGPHSMLIEGGRWRAIDEDLPEVAVGLGPKDLLITGANIIDAQGGAALLAGGPMGAMPGRTLMGMMAEGVPVLVAAGLEKLIPGTVADAVRAAGRKGVDLAMGMAVGLMSVHGRVITEVEAVRLLAPVECRVIGRGGVDGAEGGVTLAVEGEPPAVEGIFRLALALKDATTSGGAESMIECVGASSRCKNHLACIYRAPGLLR